MFEFKPRLHLTAFQRKIFQINIDVIVADAAPAMPNSGIRKKLSRILLIVAMVIPAAD